MQKDFLMTYVESTYSFYISLTRNVLGGGVGLFDMAGGVDLMPWFSMTGSGDVDSSQD